MEVTDGDSGLIGIAYLPHGTMILDPLRADLPKDAASLHSSCLKISEKIASLQPDLLILLTPHGLNLHHAFNIYQPGVSDGRASGTAQWNSEWTNYSVDVELDGAASQDLYSYLKQNQVNAQGMLAFGGLSAPLRWGEVVPLYFAFHHWTLNDVSLRPRPKVVLIAQPARGSTGLMNLVESRSCSMIGVFLDEEREAYRAKQPGVQIEFGRALRSWCDQSSKRVLLVISGDQAHTHAWSSDLPAIYQPDPSCLSIFPQAGTPYAPKFDELICRWMTGQRSSSTDSVYQLDQRLLVEEAGSIEKHARSCGYVGSLAVQGVLDKEWIENRIDQPRRSIDPLAQWLLTDFFIHCPTYYGMLGALFVRQVQK